MPQRKRPILKTIMGILQIALISIIHLRSCLTYNRLAGNAQILIVADLSGIKYEHIKDFQMPELAEMEANGVTTTIGLEPVFPSKPIPNLFSIASGLYPQYHGVVASTLYDPKFKEVFNNSKALYTSNKNAVPIWILNEQEGGTSGCMMWPGSEFAYNNRKCTYRKSFTGKTNFIEIVNDIMSWLKNPDKPANLIMMYMPDLKKISKITGMQSIQVYDMCQKINSMFRYFADELTASGISDRVNFVIISESGLTDTYAGHFLDLRQHLKEGTYKIYGESAVIQVVPNKGYENKIYEDLKTAQKLLGHFQMYKWQELPNRWNAKNSRLGPYTIVADLGYAFQDIIVETEKLQIKDSNYALDGYDITHPEMRGAFLAYGPFFKKQFKFRQMKIIDLFPLFAHVLELRNIPAHNGTMQYKKALKGINVPVLCAIIIILIILVVTSIILIYLFVAYERR